MFFLLSLFDFGAIYCIQLSYTYYDKYSSRLIKKLNRQCTHAHTHTHVCANTGQKIPYTYSSTVYIYKYILYACVRVDTTNNFPFESVAQKTLILFRLKCAPCAESSRARTRISSYNARRYCVYHFFPSYSPPRRLLCTRVRT